MTEMLLSKLAPPRKGRDIMDRPRLLSLLAGLENRKATLLQAPAGYGKTVAMLQAAEGAGHTLVWYQLDSYDNDPAVFIQYLVTGLRREFPAFGQQVLQLIEQGRMEARLRLLVSSVVNGMLQLPRPLLLVLDDFHAITDPLTLRFTQELLEHLPGTVHIMIASRAKPSLALSRLKVAGEILIIGPEELRFTGDEMRSFLAARPTPSSPEMESMFEQELNGWPALVRLAANSGSAVRKAGDISEIFDYLATEVLARLPDKVKEFLIKTSVLGVVTAEECDLLLRRDDSAEILDRLEKENLFLTRLAGTRLSYRYHQLFREFLLEQLGAERPSLQKAAGLLAKSRSDLAAAVEYFAAAGEHQELAGILKDAGQQAFRQGRWQTVQRWLEALTKEQIASDPWLSLFQARVETHRGRMDAATGWIELAAPIFAALEDRTGLAESRLLQARILRYKGFYQQSLELLEKAYPHLQTEQDMPRFDLPLEKSLSLVMTGRFKEAEVLLKCALSDAARAKEDSIVAYLLEGLGNTYYLQGEYARALQMYHKRLEIAAERDLPFYYTQDFTAAIYQEWGELDQAFEYARRNVAYKESLSLTDTLPSAYFQLADIYLNRGELKSAEEYFRRAIDLIKETSEERFYLTLNQAYLARCLSVQGRLAEAQALVEKTLEEAQAASGLALAICQELGAPIFWAYGKKREAQEMLAAAIATLEEMGFPRPLGHAYAAASLFLGAAGRQAEAAEYARRTLALSARKNYCQSFLVALEIFKPILLFGLKQGVEVVFVQKVLARLGKKALPLLEGLAKEAEAEVRRRIITPLGEIGSNRAVSVLAELADDPDLSVRQLAAEALDRIKARMATETTPRPAGAALELRTLGPLKIFRQGKFVHVGWRTAKTRDLLAFLAHQAGTIDQEAILEELWPEHDPKKAKGLFHTTLYYLRQAFRQLDLPSPIIYQNNGYELDRGVIIPDHGRFLEAIIMGLHGEASPDTTREMLEKAVAQYRGDYLAELDYPWILPQRENLRNLCGEARFWLARYYLEERRFKLALGHLRILVELNPLNEETYCLLMTAQAGLGDAAAIQKEYRALRELLARELNLTPARETQELYRRLVAGKRDLSNPA